MGLIIFLLVFFGFCVLAIVIGAIIWNFHDLMLFLGIGRKDLQRENHDLERKILANIELLEEAKRAITQLSKDLDAANKKIVAYAAREDILSQLYKRWEEFEQKIVTSYEVNGKVNVVKKNIATTPAKRRKR